jgi:rhodanese-related sulfurtransferase
MEQYTDFATQHWVLSTAFGIVLLLFLINEVYTYLTCIPKVTPEEALDLINHQQALIIDGRSSLDFNKGHILGAINIPYPQLKDALNKIEDYKTQPIILSCAMGQHSQAAGKQLRKLGYTQVVCLSGGIAGWQQNNLPLINLSCG